MFLCWVIHVDATLQSDPNLYWNITFSIGGKVCNCWSNKLISAGRQVTASHIPVYQRGRHRTAGYLARPPSQNHPDVLQFNNHQGRGSI